MFIFICITKTPLSKKTMPWMESVSGVVRGNNGARQLGTGTMTNWLLGFRLKRTDDITFIFFPFNTPTDLSTFEMVEADRYGKCGECHQRCPLSVEAGHLSRSQD